MAENWIIENRKLMEIYNPILVKLKNAARQSFQNRISFFFTLYYLFLSVKVRLLSKCHLM